MTDLYTLKKNLYYYLRNEVLFDPLNINQFSFYYRLPVAEVAVIDTSNTQIYNFGHKNLIYNTVGHGVEIYRNGMLVDPSNYSINYANGYVLFNTGYLINPVEIIESIYSYMDIDLRMAFKSAEVEIEDLPIIAIDVTSIEKNPVELGTSDDFKDRQTIFNIYAKDQNELDNMVSLLENEFDQRQLQLIDYRQGEPLDGNGFLNPGFTAPYLGQNTMWIEHIESMQMYPATPNIIDEFSMAIETVVHSRI